VGENEGPLRMKLVIFGLSISSSWGNGHATLWRGLCRALGRAGHRVVFFERDTPYYRQARDMQSLDAGELVLYGSWQEVRARAALACREADAAIVTSYCPDGVAATDLLAEVGRPLRVFYDLDTPVTLAALESGARLPYIGERGLADFDLVLSFTGGEALSLLRERLGARQVEVLYGYVDPLLHRPVAGVERYRSDLSYLGTYAADRQAKVEELLLAPASMSNGRFLLGGSMYPDAAAFPSNLVHVPHVPPAEHAAFFSSSRLTLNITRDTMARLGYCPSGRLFEAAACGAPLVSDWFEGLDLFFEPGREVQVVRDRADVLRALSSSDVELRAQAERARARVLGEHTAEHRAEQLERLLAALPLPSIRARDAGVGVRAGSTLESGEA
jgi:spore maturation protein CgeB